MRHITTAALLAAAALGLPLVAQTSASAAPAADHTAPTLTLAPTSEILGGADLSAMFGYDSTHESNWYYQTTVRLNGRPVTPVDLRLRRRRALRRGRVHDRQGHLGHASGRQQLRGGVG